MHSGACGGLAWDGGGGGGEFCGDVGGVFSFAFTKNALKGVTREPDKVTPSV